MRCIIYIITLTFLLGAPAVHAESFDDLLEKLKQHPQIQQYAAQVEQYEELSRGEMGLPDPMVFFEQQDYRLRSDMGRGGGDRMLGFSQQIPRWSVREASAGRMIAESRKTLLLKDYAYSTMKARLIATLANLQKVNDQSRVLEEQEKLLKTQKRSLESRVAANRSEVSAISMTEAELAEIKIMLAELEEEKHGIKEMLINLLGEVPDVEMPKVQMQAWKREPENTYMVAIADADVAIATKDKTIREAEFGPNFEIRASAGRMGDGSEGGSLMLGMSIPIWAAENQEPKLRAAKAGISAAELGSDVAKRDVIEMLSHKTKQITTSEEKIKLLNRKETLLKETSDAALREYEAGKTSFSDVLNIRKDMFSIQSQAIAEQANHIALIADFNRFIMKENRHE